MNSRYTTFSNHYVFNVIDNKLQEAHSVLKVLNFLYIRKLSPIECYKSINSEFRKFFLFCSVLLEPGDSRSRGEKMIYKEI